MALVSLELKAVGSSKHLTESFVDGQLPVGDVYSPKQPSEQDMSLRHRKKRWLKTWLELSLSSSDSAESMRGHL